MQSVGNQSVQRQSVGNQSVQEQSVGNQSVQRQSVGIRELRNQVAAVVRRAGGGERIIVTVDGKPVAQLGPLEPTGAPTIDDLAAAGLVRLPGRPDRPSAPEPFGVPIDVRPASVIAELRGETG